MIDFIDLFDQLPIPDSSNTVENFFRARSIPGYELHRLAKDIHGSPALLIIAEDSLNSKPLVPVSLESLRIVHNIECSISKDDSAQETELFSVIQCTSKDRVLHEYFLHILESIVLILGQNPSRDDISRAITTLIELFRVMLAPARKTTQGFWAEIFIINQAFDPIRLLQAWHKTPYDLYDFTENNQCIEVKSVNGNIREHHFSLEQLNPPLERKVIVASIYMERVSNGTSLLDILENLRSRVSKNTEALIKLNYITTTILGESWKQALETQYDYSLAKESLRFFSSENIPTVNPDLPVGVSNVHFKASLSEIQSLTLEELAQLDYLCRAVRPRKCS